MVLDADRSFRPSDSPHTGPAFAVRVNNQHDYFSVNRKGFHLYTGYEHNVKVKPVKYETSDGFRNLSVKVQHTGSFPS